MPSRNTHKTFVSDHYYHLYNRGWNRLSRAWPFQPLGSDPNDRDENGMADDTQRCGLFLADNMCDVENADSSISGNNGGQDSTAEASVGAKNTNLPTPNEDLVSQVGGNAPVSSNERTEMSGGSIQLVIQNDKIRPDNRGTKVVAERLLSYAFIAVCSLIVVVIIVLTYIRRKNGKGRK